MRAVAMLTRSGYVVQHSDLTESDRNELIVTPGTFYPEDAQSSFRIFKELPGQAVAVPRYWAQERFGPARVFVGTVCSAPRLVFDGNLRSELQINASRASVDKLQNEGGGVLCLPTGEGKTVVALHVACTLKVKTLVVVHKQFLVDQWTERIARFVPGARIGRIQQKNVDTEGHDIVVGMLQSIAMRDYGPEVFEGFGLVILDEVHVVPAPVFSQALLKVCAPCMLGMSATPERRDGMSFVINWFIGPLFMEHVLTGMAMVSVTAVPFSCNLGLANNRAAMINAVTKLCNSAKRNSLIVGIVRRLVAAGRKVIVLSDRRDHCIYLGNCIRNDGVSCMPYLGGMKSNELKKSETKDVLLATYAMAKEGLDIPDLDALVLASPRSDVVQACGRVLHGRNKDPIIVDIVDQWYIGRSQFNKRAAYYSKSGFRIVSNQIVTGATT